MGSRMAVRILGTTGMLGSMLSQVLDIDFLAMNRPTFDAERYTGGLGGDRVINCIGVTKPYCDDVERAIRVNALFPHRLPTGTIQIATDCVYSGDQGYYVESDLHDATDVYGKTKSLGEAKHLNNLRCSIIGPEKKGRVSLLEWFLAQDKATGYTNHFWNGITTLHFARICQGIIREGIELPSLQHIVPANVVTKAQLLRIIAKEYSRDIEVVDAQAPMSVDRTLATENPELNKKIWKVAGYSKPPTIEKMIKELSQL